MFPQIRSNYLAHPSLPNQPRLPHHPNLPPLIDFDAIERNLSRSYRNTLYMISALGMLLATITAIAALD